MTPDALSIDDLNALSDAEFCALFAGGAAFVGLVVTLGQQALQAETVEVAS
jgi:hypothetical protein